MDLARAGKGIIYSDCPAVINYIRSYRPEALPYLLPVVSPFVAHGRMLKQRFGADTAVVCVSSCISSKFELNQDYARGALDAVITTTELLQVRVQSLTHILCMQEEELARKVGPWPRPLGPCAREGLVCHSQNLLTSFFP